LELSLLHMSALAREWECCIACACLPACPARVTHPPPAASSVCAAVNCRTRAAAPLLLSELVEPDASGKAKPRRVGPAMSRRLHLLLTSTDPDVVVEAAGE
jgi:hypothetical protein